LCMNNNKKSKYALHLLEHSRTLGSMCVMQIIQLQKKGIHLDTIERCHIHKEAATKNHFKYTKSDHCLWFHVCHPISLTPKTHSTGYTISPQSLLRRPRLETHACIEHFVTSQPLWILHTTVHLRDTEVYPRLPANLLSRASLRNIIYVAKFKILSIPHARDRSAQSTFDNLIGLTPTPLYHVLL